MERNNDLHTPAALGAWKDLKTSSGRCGEEKLFSSSQKSNLDPSVVRPIIWSLCCMSYSGFRYAIQFVNKVS
jgi:hypothetical protein